MKRATKMRLMCIVLFGCILFAGVMTVLGWDFTRLSTAKYETNEYDIGQTYQNISIVTDTANVSVVPAEHEGHSVVCYERENMSHTVSVRDDTLVIELVDTRKWYEHIGVDFGTPGITVCIPAGEYGALSVSSRTGAVTVAGGFDFADIDITESTGNVTVESSARGAIKVKTSTGDIRVEAVSAGELDLAVSTGRVTVSGVACRGAVTLDASTGKTELTDVTCASLTSGGSTGGITLTRTVAGELLCVKRSTGNISFDGCDAGELLVQTDTGNVTGSLRSEKVFIAQTDTGAVDVPETTTGGKCKITTDTGDIRLTVSEE